MKKILGSRGYYLNKLGDVQGPMGKLLSRKYTEGGYGQVSISYSEVEARKDGVDYKYKDSIRRISQYVHILVARAYPSLILHHSKKSTFKNPKLTVRDGNRRNVAAGNLKWVDFNLYEGIYEREDNVHIRKLLLEGGKNRGEIAFEVYGNQTDASKQLVTRQKKILVDKGKIPPHSESYTILDDKLKKQLTKLLLEDEYYQKDIAYMLGLSEAQVSRFKRSNIEG